MENNTLDRLEERTRQTVEMLQTLRRDNQRLASELHAREAGGAGEALAHELQLLHEERDAVRARIEALIRALEEAP